MTSLRTSSIDNHGFEASPQATHNYSRPTTSEGSPYLTTMAGAIEEAKRFSFQPEEVHTVNDSSRAIEPSHVAPSIMSDKDTITEEKIDNAKTDEKKKTAFVISQEELENKEKAINAVMAKDLKIKYRIRMAKAGLRCVNFGCSLVVLSLVANSFSIFFATKNLPTRNNLPPWAPQSVLWPAYATLGIACISLCTAVCVLLSYWRGGHRKAEKAAIWFTGISIAGFFFMIILWGITAGIITNARNNSGGKDLWAWSCKDNVRKQLFQSDIDYDLVCRQMDWSFVCSLIEIIVETLSILLYAAAFWRFAQKTKVRKSMDVRDKIREELYRQKLEAGDMSVYRPEYDLKVKEDGYDLAELGLSSLKNLKQQSADIKAAAIPTTAMQEKSETHEYYPPVPVPSYVGAGMQPIIDPNTGLPYQQHY